MNFWVSYLLGFASCAASLGVFLAVHCLRLAGKRDAWMQQAHVLERMLTEKCDEPTEIVWRDGIPVLTPVEAVEWPETLEVN